jgi:thiopeptide-type bacteriocin biosynthesis protein
MPQHHPASQHSPTAPGLGPAEHAVLAMLTGTPAAQAARPAGTSPAVLAAAARAYQQAGRAALHSISGQEAWGQVHVEFTSWATAEHDAVVLAQSLDQADAVSRWWFLRKHPCWRIRYQPATATPALTSILDQLTAAAVIRSWRHSIYEPETLAFGGPAGLAIAHDLFTADTRGVLARTRDGHGHGAGHRELSVLLCATLIRAAGLDWFEQGDTWHRVALLRPSPAGPPGRHHDTIGKLLTVSTSPGSPLLAPAGPLASATTWISGFRDAGRALATAAQHSRLHRGVRDILTHLIIFHWNRLGLSATTQATLADAARDVILSPAAPAGSP